MTSALALMAATPDRRLACMTDNAKQATRSKRTRDRIAGYMSAFSRELARLMEARGLGVREVARRVPCNPGHISNLRNGKARPSPELAADLDTVLGADGTLAGLAPPATPLLAPHSP